MRTLIIGANGNIGKRMVRRMNRTEGLEPTAFIRKESQKAYFEDMGVSSIIEDLQNDEETLADAIEGFDAVVFTAGSGAGTAYDKTMEIDLYGAVKAIHAANEKGVRRFLMISAAFAGDDSKWPDSMKPYYIAKHLADKELMRSELDFTILRPVRLTDDEEAGKIKISSDPNQLNKEITREAVAQSVLDCLKNKSTIGKILEMSEGEENIDKAIKDYCS